MKGTVVRKRDEGYGFIKPEDGDKDVFFHASAVAEGGSFDDINENDTVEFDVEEGPKGPAAANVVKVDASAAPAADDAAATDDAADATEEAPAEEAAAEGEEETPAA